MLCREALCSPALALIHALPRWGGTAAARPSDRPIMLLPPQSPLLQPPEERDGCPDLQSPQAVAGAGPHRCHLD